MRALTIRVARKEYEDAGEDSMRSSLARHTEPRGEVRSGRSCTSPRQSFLNGSLTACSIQTPHCVVRLLSLFPRATLGWLQAKSLTERMSVYGSINRSGLTR